MRWGFIETGLRLATQSGSGGITEAPMSQGRRLSRLGNACWCHKNANKAASFKLDFVKERRESAAAASRVSRGFP